MCVVMSPGADIKTAILATPDHGESVFLMEPLLIGETSRFRGKLIDLAVELAQKAAGFRRSLPETLLASLAGLVRSMNCYYSPRAPLRLAFPAQLASRWMPGMFPEKET
jgi:hypothetical protein